MSADPEMAEVAKEAGGRSATKATTGATRLAGEPRPRAADGRADQHRPVLRSARRRLARRAHASTRRSAAVPRTWRSPPPAWDDARPWYTKVGDDPLGEVALAELREFGVDLRFAAIEPGTVTPLAFAVLDPPEDPQLCSAAMPPVPDLQLPAGRGRLRHDRNVPRPVDLGRRAVAGAQPQHRGGDARSARAPRAHGPRPRLPPELLALARGGLRTDRRGRRPRHRRGGQPGGVRGRRRHARTPRGRRPAAGARRAAGDRQARRRRRAARRPPTSST